MLRAAPHRNTCGRQSAWRQNESRLFARRLMRTRKAILPDAQQIHALIAAYSSDGTLLPRTLAEICENVRDFIVLEHAGQLLGCGALHLYGPHPAEIRSVAVDAAYPRGGGRRRQVKALLAQAER